MKDYAVLTNDGKYTIFEFNNQRIRFITSDKLERYTKIVEWDNGYDYTKDGDYIRVLNLNCLNNAAVIYKDEILETNMDDIEI